MGHRALLMCIGPVSMGARTVLKQSGFMDASTESLLINHNGAYLSDLFCWLVLLSIMVCPTGFFGF